MIDAHFHILELACGDCGWLTLRATASCGASAGILAEAAPSEAETHFLLQQAHGAADVLGVVGRVDMLAADAPTSIPALARHAKLKGLRPMLQDITDPDWIVQDTMQHAFVVMVTHKLAFDALVKPVLLPRIGLLARRYPVLRIVVEHRFKPDIALGHWQGLTDALEHLACLGM